MARRTTDPASIAGTRSENRVPKSLDPDILIPVINGLLLTHDESNGSYAIILHNVRTYRSAGVVAVVRSKRKAEEILKEYQHAQSSSDHHEGWRYFIEKTSLNPGTATTASRGSRRRSRTHGATSPRPTGSAA